MVMVRSLLFLLLFVPAFHSIPAQRVDSSGPAHRSIEVPSSWIEAVREQEASEDGAAPLVERFEQLIAPDTLIQAGSELYRKERHWYINPIFVDIDMDPEVELLALIGRSRWDPMLAVFDQGSDGWELVFHKSFYVYYERPEIELLNVPSPHKTFSIWWLYGRGTGYYHDSEHFFKLIDGRVVHGLGTTRNAHTTVMNSHELNKVIRGRSGFDGLYQDRVRMIYELQLSMITAKGDRIEILDEQFRCDFEWDPQKEKYRPTMEQERLKRFQDPVCKDSLFVKAFRPELAEFLRSGEERKVRAFRRYLEQLGTPTAEDLLKEKE